MPPDTEIIKYTSSIVGPKIPGTTTRGRKKTISDEQQQLLQQKQELDSTTNALSSLLAFPGLSPAKRARLEMEYAAIAAAANAAQQGAGVGAAGLPTNLTASQVAALTSTLSGAGGGISSSSVSSQQNPPQIDLTTTSSSGGGRSSRDSSSDRVEVIKLPPTITSNGAYNLSNKNKDVHDLTGGTDINSGVNLSLKPAATIAVGNITLNSANAAAPITIEDFDTPLNLSMKPDKSSTSNNSNDLSGNNANAHSASSSNSLQSLSSITAALGNNGSASVSGGNGGSSTGCNVSSNNGNERNNQPPFKEGRPRNLGRGVSKPKKNTVASLLAQSRAVGIKPMLATQQLLQQGADIVSNCSDVSQRLHYLMACLLGENTSSFERGQRPNGCFY